MPNSDWFNHIDKGCLKARHGDYVLYKVDYLLDNLAREVNIMESARRMNKITYCDECEKAMDCDKWKKDERICGCYEGIKVGDT